jgi:hypothetical protein
VCLLTVLLSLCPDSWIPVRLSQRCSLNVSRILDADMLACITKEVTSRTMPQCPFRISKPACAFHRHPMPSNLRWPRSPSYACCRQIHDMKPSKHSRVATSCPHALHWYQSYPCHGQSLPKYAKERTWQAKVLNASRFPFVINN